MNYQPEIAIVEANTLTCLGLERNPGGNDSYGNHTDFSSLQRTDGRYSRYVCPLFHFRTDLRGAQCFLSPRKRKRLYWQATVRNSNCPAYLYSTFTNPKKSW